MRKEKRKRGPENETEAIPEAEANEGGIDTSEAPLKSQRKKTTTRPKGTKALAADPPIAGVALRKRTVGSTSNPRPDEAMPTEEPRSEEEVFIPTWSNPKE